MLAFCFLTLDDVIREDVWSQFFKGVSKNKYCIYSHPKCANKILSQPLFRETIVPTIAPTRWGTFSLLEAQQLLMVEALKNKTVTHIIFISHCTIPIQSFDSLFTFLKDKGSVFYYTPKHTCNYRYKGLINPPFPVEQFYKHAQWCVLDREDAVNISKDHVMLRDIFGKSVVPDEHVYGNYLIHVKRKYIGNRFNMTYVTWDGSHPTTISKITAAEIADMVKGKFFFIRKVDEKTDCTDISFMTA